MEYTVQAVERATGITGSRLRTWERRYGVPSPPRSPSGRRLYSEDDVQLVRRMAALIEAGISVAQAADAVKAGESWAPPPAIHVEPSSPSPIVANVVANLVEGARRLDSVLLDDILVRASHELGWADALDFVVFPALRRVGDEWPAGHFTPAHEHLLSEAVRLRLSAAAAEAAPSPARPLVVMACPEDEMHDLGLASLRLLLRQGGVTVSYLGADVPTRALIEAVESLRPQAVVLSGVTGASEPTIALAARELLQSKWRGQVFVGGSAVHWTGALGIPGELLPERLSDATRVILGRLAAPMHP